MQTSKFILKLRHTHVAMAIVVAATTSMMLALVMLLLGFAGATQILAQLQLPSRTNTSNSRLNAEPIYESNSVTADSDVEDLVIRIPGSSGDNGSKWQGFLPGSATVVIAEPT